MAVARKAKDRAHGRGGGGGASVRRDRTRRRPPRSLREINGSHPRTATSSPARCLSRSLERRPGESHVSCLPGCEVLHPHKCFSYFAKLDAEPLHALVSGACFRQLRHEFRAREPCNHTHTPSVSIPTCCKEGRRLERCRRWLGPRPRMREGLVPGGVVAGPLGPRASRRTLRPHSARRRRHMPPCCTP